MKKAILELEAPESCTGCPLKIWAKDFEGHDARFCVPIYERNHEYTKERAPFCPLKIVEEEQSHA